MNTSHPLLEYLASILGKKGYIIRDRKKDSIIIAKSLDNHQSNSQCEVDLRLPRVGSDYLVEVVAYRGNCVETVVDTAKLVEEKLDALFNPRDIFSKIKDVGISVGLTGFYFTLSRQVSESRRSVGRKNAPLEVTVRIGLYTVIKFVSSGIFRVNSE